MKYEAGVFSYSCPVLKVEIFTMKREKQFTPERMRNQLSKWLSFSFDSHYDQIISTLNQSGIKQFFLFINLKGYYRGETVFLTPSLYSFVFSLSFDPFFFSVKYFCHLFNRVATLPS